MRKKSPAALNIGIDTDARVVAAFRARSTFPIKLVVARAEDFLASYDFKGDEFIYSDPPYWPESRRSRRKVYTHDYSEDDHRQLIKLLRSVPCPVMISGYDNLYYDEALRDWTKRVFTAPSRTGLRQESVWMNYEPGHLHDTRFLGGDFRAREAIKRKRLRWARRFHREPVAVQQALLADLIAIHGTNSTAS